MKISAILLVGGKGTRLMPLTQHTPKPMLEVAGVPFTEHQIRKAAKAGISEIVLATSYKAELFEPYFGDGEKFGIKIKYAVETTALGTGGGIKNAAELIEACDQVVVFNGDVLSGHDLSSQIKLHQRNNADVTLYLTEVLDARAYGCVEIENNNRVKSFLEKMDNPISNLINAGCYIFNPAIINTIPKGQVVSVERETFPNLIASNAKIFGF
ncbi:MAG: nucleotidyltransferase family protein, partial [Actinobacteria bacterium]|nr:nucleotidyltransferase family protein [Actinomycetota bacterium]